MRVLVIGGGGREHALIWKLRQSSQVDRIWCIPGNGGISKDAECLVGDLGDVSGLARVAAGLGADLTVVGPEMPLVLGIADEFARRGLSIVGPMRGAAELEGSKIFAKQFMARHDIPTAAVYGIHDAVGEACASLKCAAWPVVLKADGLCAGKGVLVAESPAEAREFVARAIERREFGAAGRRILVEEALAGQELSYIVMTDGEKWSPLAPTRDHKRALNGDKGPNTGGMGAYSCASLLGPGLEAEIGARVVAPTIRGLSAEGRPYRGFLYFGLMLTREGPKVLEFNCRLGDPETEAIVLRMDFDLAAALALCAHGDLGSFVPQWRKGASACVVMASEGYPGQAKVGRFIEGIDRVRRADAVVFHAGTRASGDDYYSSGGRVLVVSAYGESLDSALGTVYDVCSGIRFEGCHYRTDVGRADVRYGVATVDSRAE